MWIMRDREIVEIIDFCLKSRNIREGYEYVASGGASNDVVDYMLETWSIEESHGEKTILWNVYSYQELYLKWQKIDNAVRLILQKAELTPDMQEFVEKEVSVWAVLVWVLKTGLDQIQQTTDLDTLIGYWKNHNLEKVQILETIYMENISNIVTESISRGFFYLAKKYAKKAGMEAGEIIERGIRKIEREIEGRLYTPTCMQKIGNNYMIADCWHDRVIYSEHLVDIREWNVLDNNLWHPHSVCEGRGIYATENTEKGSVCFYKNELGRFVKIDEIFLGNRPHRVVYDEDRDMFWVLVGNTPELYGIKPVNDHMEQCYQLGSGILQFEYARSMRMIHNKFYIVSTGGIIEELAFENGEFMFENTYTVPSKYCRMNDMIFLDGYFWISVYGSDSGASPALLKIRSLEDFATGEYEDVYDELGMKGIPYFFSVIDKKMCIPEIDTYSRIVLYDVQDGELRVSRVLYDFGKPKREDILYDNRHEPEFVRKDIGELLCS